MKKYIFTLAVLFTTFLGFGQRTPNHPMDIPEGSTDLYQILENWIPGTPPSGTDKYNDQFYISRVRPLKRIIDGDYQVKTGVDRERKLCLWVPLDDPTASWKSLPRYSFEGDNFSMWSYTDIHGNWTAPWMRVSAGITDVAHKNGVKVGCVNSIPWAAYVIDSKYNERGKVFFRLFEKEADGTFKYSMRLVSLMKYYGIDGLGCNSEFRTNQSFMQKLMAFSQDCHRKAKEIGWEFQLHWYDGTNDNGSISFDSGLGTHNDGVFGEGGSEVTDMLFFNYNWGSDMLDRSVKKAEQMNRSSYDLYAGFDIQKEALKQNWKTIQDNKVSIGFWGAHSQSLIHQSATDDGTSDIAIQKAYLLKQELIFSGGYRNPGLTPNLRNNATLANADLKTFHGLSTFLSAKSTLQHIPFVTRFSLGNGLFFNNQGVTTFDHKWHNINTQDFLPNWRWWITDKNDKVVKENIDKLIKADFVFEDAWFGGSCLKIHGQTDFSRVKLFKTKLFVQPTYTLSLTYKILAGIETKAKVFIAKSNNITEYKEIQLPNPTKKEEWTTHTVSLSELGIVENDVISMIGLQFENTDQSYEMLVGELAIKNPTQNFETVVPTITKVDILRGRHNQLDFKIFYQSKEEKNGEKTYNDEVGTWYYEIYFQQQNQKPQLLTATTSWAGYVIDAPIVATDTRKGRFGVRAIAPDGSDESPISWTDYQEIPYDNPIETVIIDKPIVKPNEEFSVKFEDQLHTPAQKWEVKDPLTDKTIAEASNTTQLTTSISKEGLYDLYLTNDKGETTITRGFVQITPIETGAVPQILTFEANATSVDMEQEVTYDYTAKLGEGTVSRALKINDPDMFSIPAAVQEGYEYSYALWFKVEKYSHDKQGTNLINKNSIADKWPHNNWGDLWVTIRPKSDTHQANEISYNTMGWTAHDRPNEQMQSTGFSVTPNVWNHIVITQNRNKEQKMYFNGKMVAETTFANSKRREDSGDGRINSSVAADIYIGGGNVYKAGFNGWIDEVQVWNKALTDKEVETAMKGYDVAPDGLIAYYTFEEKIGKGTFENKGKGGDLKGVLVKMDGSGGESTATASYVPVLASNDETGQPGIKGSLNIKTTPTWLLEATNIDDVKDGQVGNSITVKYLKSGTFDAGLVLTNQWSKDTTNKEKYITVRVGAGIAETSPYKFDYFPNPFVDKVNIQFVKNGEFTINVVNLQGQLLSTKQVVANENDFVTVGVDAPAGTYLINILEKGQLLQSLKVLKK